MKVTFERLECEADHILAMQMIIKMFKSSVEDIKEYKDFTEKNLFLIVYHK